jgi:hypothetical protein
MNIVIDANDLADITQTLVTRALNSGSVFRTALDAGITVFAYPSENELLIGIGVGRDRLDAHTIEDILSRRFASPQRYACWLPALFADGGFYVIQRRPRSTAAGTYAPTTEEIGDALALLAA